MEDTIPNTQTKIIELTNSIQKLLLVKNQRYGDAAITPKRRFSKASPEQGILIRLDDKLNRIEQSDELRINDISDMIGYLVLLLIAKGLEDAEAVSNGVMLVLTALGGLNLSFEVRFK